MTCEKIAKLLLGQQDHELPLYTRFMIRIHLVLCVDCRRLERHLWLIRKVSETAGDTRSGSPLETESLFPAVLPPEAKALIKQALAQHGH